MLNPRKTNSPRRTSESKLERSRVDVERSKTTLKNWMETIVSGIFSAAKSEARNEKEIVEWVSSFSLSYKDWLPEDIQGVYNKATQETGGSAASRIVNAIKPSELRQSKANPHKTTLIGFLKAITEKKKEFQSSIAPEAYDYSQPHVYEFLCACEALIIGKVDTLIVGNPNDTPQPSKTESKTSEETIPPKLSLDSEETLSSDSEEIEQSKAKGLEAKLVELNLRLEQLVKEGEDFNRKILELNASNQNLTQQNELEKQAKEKSVEQLKQQQIRYSELQEQLKEVQSKLEIREQPQQSEQELETLRVKVQELEQAHSDISLKLQQKQGLETQLNEIQEEQQKKELAHSQALEKSDEKLQEQKRINKELTMLREKESEEAKARCKELLQTLEETKNTHQQEQIEITGLKKQISEVSKQIQISEANMQASKLNLAANICLFGAVGLATAAICTYLPEVLDKGVGYLGIEARSTLGNVVSGGTVFLVLAAASQIGSNYKPHKATGLLVPTYLAAAYDCYTTGDKFSVLICFGSALIMVGSWVSQVNEVSVDQVKTV